MRHALWIALVVVVLAVIAGWMWFYRAPPAVPAESRQSVTAEPAPISPVR
jgi:hypothetical protein